MNQQRSSAPCERCFLCVIAIIAVVTVILAVIVRRAPLDMLG